MSPKKRLVPILVAAALGAGLASEANAQNFGGVVVFGDSLSDVGYYRPYLSSIGLPPATVAGRAGSAGRCSSWRPRRPPGRRCWRPMRPTINSSAC
jgi:hypothetical protein